MQATYPIVPALERAAADPEPLIAEHAVWAIEQIGARDGINPWNRADRVNEGSRQLAESKDPFSLHLNVIMNGISFARVQQPTNPDAFTPRTGPTMHQTVSTPAPAPLTAKQRRARRKKQIIYGSIGLIVLCIVASIIWSKREKPIPVTTEKAVRKTILQTVSATGKVQPETEVKISPEVAGEIIELPVEDGKAVKKGDLLVRIKPDSYKALLEQQEAAISSAKATNLQQKATMLKMRAGS